MANFKLLAGRTIFPLLMVVSCVAGYYMPAFYDWTGSDQSVSPPIVGQIAGGLTLATVFISVLLPSLPIDAGIHDGAQPFRMRFKTKTLLLMVGAIALIFAGLLVFGTVVSGILCASAFLYTMWSGITTSRDRLPVLALICCMILPYLWIFAHGEMPDFSLEMIWLLSALPAFLPSALASSWTGQHPEELSWLPMFLTSTEYMLGICMIRLGPKPATVYLLFVLLLSNFGSFGLYSLMRA